MSNVVVFVLGLCLVPGVSWGLVDVDITFSAGATPLENNFRDVAGQAQVDTAAGVWNANYPSGTHAFFGHGGSLPQPVTDLIDGPIFHGTAEITHTTFAGGAANQTLMFLRRPISKTDPFVFELNAVDGNVLIQNPNGTGLLDTIAVNNNDGNKHVYGWEVDLGGTPGPNIVLYFDGSVVGDAAGYQIPGALDFDQNYFGDGTNAGGHEEVWDRVTIQEGRIPEPGTLVLLAPAAVLMFLRRRHSC